MVRRCLFLVVLMGLTAMTAAGCEGFRQSIRSADNGPRSVKSAESAPGAFAVETDPTKLQAVDSTDKNPQPFFKSNRRSGGWSSEAREIESHLGVGP